jgi:hypothetical protein
MTTGLDALLAQVDPARMTATVTQLASAAFAGRRTGSAGGIAARDWLRDHLTGLDADVSTDPFAVRAVPEIHAAAGAIWHDGAVARGLAFGRQVTAHLASAYLPGRRRGDLGIAGAGDPTGRWLLVPASMSLFDAYGHAGSAAGLLIARPVDADGWHYTLLAGPDPGPLPVLTLDPATHAAMVESAGAGRGWLEASAPIRRADVTAANLHGHWGANDGGLLLTAHYDGVGDLPGLRQPAASDNASGVAVILEAARVLAPVMPAELAIAVLDAEEIGALGSAHHAARLRQAAVRPSVINVDGAGRLGAAAAVEAGGPAHALLAVLDQAGRHTGVPLAPGPMASDNRRYAAAGFAAIGIGAGMGGYHSPADTPDRVDPVTLAAVCRLVVATAWLASGKLSSLIGDRR